MKPAYAVVVDLYAKTRAIVTVGVVKAIQADAYEAGAADMRERLDEALAENARMRSALVAIHGRNPQGAELGPDDDADVCPECERQMQLRDDADGHSVNVCDSCIHEIAQDMEELARKAIPTLPLTAPSAGVPVDETGRKERG